MKKIGQIFIVSLLMITFVGCDYLDVVPDKMGTIEYAFRERAEAEKYLATCYRFLPELENKQKNAGRTWAGEIFTFQQDQSRGVRLTREGNNSNDPFINYWDGRNEISSNYSMFKALRSCNIFLDNLDLVADLDPYTRDRWRGEVTFLKAYYHWWLVLHYGPIPLIRENLPNDAPTEDVRVFRDPLDDCIDYIVELLDDASELLPHETVGTDTEMYGHVSLPAVYALKAKVLVHAASPFFNGNPMYANFKDNRGINLWPVDYDLQKWVIARDACKQAIDICHDLGYGLYNYDPSMELGTFMNDSMRLMIQPSEIFTTTWRQILNREVIWALSRVNTNQTMYDVYPSLYDIWKSSSINMNLAPTISTAERFYSSNGVPIEEDVEWMENEWYANRFTMRIGDRDHRYFIAEGLNTAQLHFNREYRFYGSVSFDNHMWYLHNIPMSIEDENMPEKRLVPVKAKANEAAGRASLTSKHSVTGYFIRKLCMKDAGGSIPPATNHGWQSKHYAWPVFRIADLYLLYAETLNETAGPEGDANGITDPESPYTWLNLIRLRAGIGTVGESWDNFSNKPDKYRNKDGLRDIIHQERMIELAFEGDYAWDIRRWSGGATLARYDIMNIMNQPIRGWNVGGATDEDYYMVRNIIIPKFSVRDYLWPIRNDNFYTNPNLAQNPGW